MDLAEGYHLMIYSPTGVKATAVELQDSTRTLCRQNYKLYRLRSLRFTRYRRSAVGNLHMQLTYDWLPGKRGSEQSRGEIMCGVARKIIAVVGTEMMLSNMGCNANGHIWYVRCTFYGVRTVTHICIQYYLTCIYTTISAAIQQT